MYKKIIISGLFLLSGFSAQASTRNKPPYEDTIKAQYDRTHAGINRYTSIDAIINKPSRGIPVAQRNQNIADLQDLKMGVQRAIDQAESDGRRAWYYAYIWKDTQAAITNLYEYKYDIDLKLAEYARQSQSDLEKLARYLAPYMIGAVVTITALWLSQGYYLREGEQSHGFFEMQAAPITATYDATKYIGTKLLLATSYAAGSIKNGADYLAGVQHPVPPIPPQA